MPGVKSRIELRELIQGSYAKLESELRRFDNDTCHVKCVDDWSVKDLISVRSWWTEQVVKWIDQGKRGKRLDLPKRGYTWKETPRLNSETVEKFRSRSYSQICTKLNHGVKRVLLTIDGLSNRQLLDAKVFEWTGTWPISRWISVNTARQYSTARTHLRRAIKNYGDDLR